MVGAMLQPAPIDEKNVTTDWINDVFDDCIECGNDMIGYINGVPLHVTWHDNILCWEIVGAKRILETSNELKRRLEEYEKDEDSTIMSNRLTCGYLTTQAFYFKPDNA